MPIDRITEDDRERVAAFVRARLLMTDAVDGTAVLEVAHEALFRSWERLKDWIAKAQEDLILLRQVRNAAAEWHERGRPDFLLWPAERLQPVYAMIERLQPDLNDVERDFIEPEQVRLYRELGFEVQYIDGLTVDVTPAEQIAETSHQRRYVIGERLNDIGELRQGLGVKDGLPDMLWLPVGGSSGKVEFSDNDGKVYGTFEVQPFFIAKYLTTCVQFQAFFDSGEYDDPRWWAGFPDNYRPQQPRNVTNGNANAPRDTVSWYQSVAFSRWLTAKCEGLELAHPSGQILRVGDNADIRLPAEWEWQWAAMGGTERRKYPWGEWDEHPRANTEEAGIQKRSTAVGMYPYGAADCGALDMAGNLWEWCQNDHKNPSAIDGYSNTNIKVLRGGAFGYLASWAAASSRSYLHPLSDDFDYGLRLVCGCVSPK